MSLVFSIFFALLFTSIPTYAELRLDNLPHFVVSIVLALLTFCLYCIYIISTHYEFDLLQNYIDDSDLTRVTPKNYFVAIGLAILFGTLMASAHNILLYAIIMVHMNMFDVWGGWQVARRLEPAFERAIESSEKNAKRIEEINTLKSYYLDNPTLPRVVTLLYANAVVVCLAIVYSYNANDTVHIASYILLTANIAIGEFVIFRWRKNSVYKLARSEFDDVRVFISYRRQEAGFVNDSIYQHLVANFGPDSVFKDVYSIASGVDFPTELDSAVSKCDVLISLIGPKWASLFENRDEDFVLKEIETAILKGVKTIPVLLEDTDMPTPDQLPDGIKPLLTLNAISIRTESDVQQLIADIKLLANA